MFVIDKKGSICLANPEINSPTAMRTWALKIWSSMTASEFDAEYTIQKGAPAELDIDTVSKLFSTNPFEFIRQCQQDLRVDSKQSIAAHAWINGPEFAGRVLHILSKVGSAEMAFLQVQRRMIRDLAKEMLGKILYTQKEFAGKLIATMEEFGVGVAFVESDVAYFGTVWVYTVTSYTPEGWGIRQTFNSDDDENARETAYRLAEKINNFGNFNL